jgi:hypothetical protein
MLALLAGWQSGYAAACKAVDAGSIPTPASNQNKPFNVFVKCSDETPKPLLQAYGFLHAVGQGASPIGSEPLIDVAMSNRLYTIQTESASTAKRRNNCLMD